MKRFFALLVMIMAMTSTCLAMTFSQPIEIGWIGWSQRGGGFAFKNQTYNNGDFYTKYDKNNKYTYGKGTVCFGSGVDALYVYYNSYVKDKTNVRFGSSDINNTVSIDVFNDWIYKITSDEGITIYAIRFYYGSDSEWRFLGNKKDGTFVKYINTVEITKKYFGVNPQGGASPIFYDTPKCQEDTIVLPYKNMRLNPKNIVGEFRFKWDDAAQWFGVEQVVY